MKTRRNNKVKKGSQDSQKNSSSPADVVDEAAASTKTSDSVENLTESPPTIDTSDDVADVTNNPPTAASTNTSDSVKNPTDESPTMDDADDVNKAPKQANRPDNVGGTDKETDDSQMVSPPRIIRGNPSALSPIRPLYSIDENGLFVQSIVRVAKEKQGLALHYHVLNLERTATVKQVVKAYRKLILRCHPDKNKHPDASAAFRIVTDAKDIVEEMVKERATIDERYETWDESDDEMSPEDAAWQAQMDEQIRENLKKWHKANEARREATRKAAEEHKATRKAADEHKAGRRYDSNYPFNAERAAANNAQRVAANKARAAAREQARRDAYYISSDSSSDSESDSDKVSADRAEHSASKSTDNSDAKSESNDSTQQKDSNGTFMSKGETLIAIRELHLELRFLDTVHMFMLPKMWLTAAKFFPDEDTRDEIRDYFLSAILTDGAFFVEDDFPDWNPKIHGPRNFLQSFYIAALAHKSGRLKDFPMADTRYGLSQETRSSANNASNEQYESDSSVQSEAMSSSSEKEPTTSPSKGKKNKGKSKVNKKVNRHEMFTDALKKHCIALKKKDDNFFTDDETVQDHRIALLPLKSYLDPNLDRISLLDLENEMDREDLPDNFSFFEIAYCGHTPSSYARTQMEQALELLECHFRPDDHECISDILCQRKTQMVCMYFVYRAKKNEEISSITSLDQKAYEMEPTYGKSGMWRRHMISVVVFSTSFELQSMLVDYAGTEAGILDNYSDAAPDNKSIRGLGSATLLLHIAQCFAFLQTQHVTAILIAENTLHSFYTQLGFKKIKDFKSLPKFKDARQRFHYANHTDEDKIVAYKCSQTIPRRVTKLYDARYIGKRDVLFKTLNVCSPYVKWFPCKFIEDFIKKSHKNETKVLNDKRLEVHNYYMELLNASSFTNIDRMNEEIDKFLTDRNHFEFFTKMFNKWAENDGSTTTSQSRDSTLPAFESFALSQFQFYKNSESINCFVCKNCNLTFRMSNASIPEQALCFTHLLHLHTGVRKWSRKNVYDQHLKAMNPLIHERCSAMNNSQALFEQYRIALHQEISNMIRFNEDIIVRACVFHNFLIRMFRYLGDYYYEDKEIVVKCIADEIVRQQEYKKAKEMNHR